MNTTERSATIRAELKRRGITSRQVSVKTDLYSMGSSIRVRVNDPSVSLEMVRDLAEQHESIRRDHFGEILSGGNRFVEVSYSHEAVTALADKFAASVNAAAAKLDGEGNSIERIEGTDLGVQANNGRFTVWQLGDHGRCLTDAYDLRGVAEIVGSNQARRAALRSQAEVKS